MLTETYTLLTHSVSDTCYYLSRTTNVQCDDVDDDDDNDEDDDDDDDILCQITFAQNKHQKEQK